MKKKKKRTHRQIFSCEYLKEVHVPWLCFSISQHLFLGNQHLVKNILCSVICHREIENLLIVQ